MIQLNAFIMMIFAVLVSNIALLIVKKLRNKNINNGWGIELIVCSILSGIMLIAVYVVYMSIFGWN